MRTPLQGTRRDIKALNARLRDIRSEMAEVREETSRKISNLRAEAAQVRALVMSLRGVVTRAKPQGDAPRSSAPVRRVDDIAVGLLEKHGPRSATDLQHDLKQLGTHVSIRGLRNAMRRKRKDPRLTVKKIGREVEYAWHPERVEEPDRDAQGTGGEVRKEGAGF